MVRTRTHHAHLKYRYAPASPCTTVIAHDRICTHILAFKDEAQVEWFQGSFEDYREDKKRRLGEIEPRRMKHKKHPVGCVFARTTPQFPIGA